MNRIAIFAMILVVIVLSVYLLLLQRGNHAEQKVKNDDTVVREQAFQLILPGKWTSAPSNDPTRFSYHTDIDREFLTVSVGSFERRLTEQDQRAAAERLIAIHRGLQQKVPGVTALTMTDITYGQSKSFLAARYSGFEPARQRRFHSLLLCSPIRFTVYYYEALGLNETQAADRARTIMNSIVVN